MGFSDHLSGNFIKYKQWGPKEAVMTVNSARFDTFKDGNTQLVLGFDEIEGEIGFGKLTMKLLQGLYGDDEQALLGKRFNVYGDPNVSMDGQLVGGIRLRPVTASSPQPPAIIRPTSDDAGVWKAYCVANVLLKNPAIPKAEQGAFVKKTVTDFFPAGTELVKLGAEDWKRFEQAGFGTTISADDIQF